MLEKELKALISKHTYEVLCQMFPDGIKKEQTNHYYMSPNNILKKHGITLRVRTIDNKHKIQVKKHIARENALQICEELEQDIESVPNSFSGEEINKLTEISVPALKIGSLTTLRTSYMFCDGVEICIDKSDYLGCTDYEIEIEYTNVIPTELTDRLSTVGITFDKPSIGKFSRFMNQLSKLKNAETV